MVLVDFRGKDSLKYVYVSMRQDLDDCIDWLIEQRKVFNEKGRVAGSIIDYKGFEDDDI